MGKKQQKEPEFWRVLKSPPRKIQVTEDEIAAILSKQLRGEVDRQILYDLLEFADKEEECK